MISANYWRGMSLLNSEGTVLMMRRVCSLVLLVSCAGGGPVMGAPPRPPITHPDFTKGDTVPEKGPHDWTLGSTGVRGWIFTSEGNSRDARQILITAIAKWSPAEGVLEVGDVILGVDGKVFEDDARVTFAKAITGAETTEAEGVLKLLRWRDGGTATVAITLPSLGTYSATAPYDCPKSRRIVEGGCAALARRMADLDYGRGMHSIPRSLNALALLASGDKEFLPLVAREAKWAADFKTDGYKSWDYGYLMMFLAEYVMATKHQSVMPGLARLALETARGQSAVGTWGHRFALPSGNLNGYGCMNQPGLPLVIGMVLAREAGVNEPEIDRAITKASGFLRWYVDKGAVPYGDHPPYPAHEDNGKCASAAVLFDLLGDQEAATYFSKMATAAYGERERGHTGNYFNMVWALLGVARTGPLGVGAYMQEHGWYYDLARDHTGKFIYQGSPVGEEDHGKYSGWDCSGSFLLAYELPLKSLRITGKKPFGVKPLDAGEVADVIKAGRDGYLKNDGNPYAERSTPELFAGLTSWSPVVRRRSAVALGAREEDVLPQVIALLEGTNRYGRYGACEALGALGQRADAAGQNLRRALADSDPWLQSLAAQAILALGPSERAASVGDLLAVAVRKNPADLRRHAALYASMVLFSKYPRSRPPARSILEESLDGADRAQLHEAIRSLLQHEDSIARDAAGSAFRRLTDEDLVALLPDITRAIEKIAPSNEMFADGVRIAGLDLLSRLHVTEGMNLCVAVIEPDRWGMGGRLTRCVALLPRYGTHAKTVLPQLHAIRVKLAAAARRGPTKEMEALDACIAAIEASTDTPTLVSIKDFKSQAL